MRPATDQVGSVVRSGGKVRWHPPQPCQVPCARSPLHRGMTPLSHTMLTLSRVSARPGTQARVLHTHTHSRELGHRSTASLPYAFRKLPQAAGWATRTGRGHQTEEAEAEAGDFQKDRQHQTCCRCADWLTKGRGKRASLRQAFFCSSFLLLGREKHLWPREEIAEREGRPPLSPTPRWTPRHLSVTAICPVIPTRVQERATCAIPS